MTDDQAEMLATAIRSGLRDIGAGDAQCIGTSPVEALCNSLNRIAKALEKIAEVESHY